ncbi:sigma-70 family RNA polymerase sigma factor [Aestuariibacter halophilus]|uniref:Sigma-70 family RNA polymerase sigma factor n=1 Tax=Fluctibacter halophilus TaxID=226011 RepID=A0ABS8G7G1_9ALTE|nr:sigma-70 family RNA polymerase sigma factor [Aestuariibacter halophilus]MCC2616532.1 sigma-70 family RNA polymerase sigma factor [Aestuariibacter halophilus]
MVTTPTLTALYKQHGPQLLATLTGLLGTHNFALAEDVLQDAFSIALTDWQANGVPDNPQAWLLTTARHRAIDAVRKHKTHLTFAPALTHQLSSEWSAASVLDNAFTPQQMHQDQLRMMFVCCHPSIKPANRLVFILRHLCGLSLTAISRALLLPGETVKKRLTRCKEQIKPLSFALPDEDARVTAMDSVHTVLYLLFNEGFHGTGEQALDLSLCREAVDLVTLLTDSPALVNQDTLGLYALMHYHLARAPTRLDNDGALLPLDQQDRSAWQQDKISLANRLLSVAETLPPAVGRFYLEAMIARQHCAAARFADTPWPRIVQLYDMLYRVTASPLARINQAIALGYAGQPQQALSLIDEVQDHPALQHSPMVDATRAHLHAKLGDAKQAYALAEAARAKGGTAREHQLMMQQLAALLATPGSGSDALPR